MEFSARFALTGLFTLAVGLAVLVFVYWLNSGIGFGEQTRYRILYRVPVSGLVSGSDVLFNGLKVGEVESLGFDSANPGGVVATVSVMKATPIRTDTAVGIDFQGLTGAASVLMTGGSADAPPPVANDGRPPLIEADPSLSRSWTQKAGRVLSSIDDLISRNSGRFDAILSGLERLAGGSGDGAAQNVVYDLPAATSFDQAAGPVPWQLVVGEPTVVLSLNTDKVQEQLSSTAWRPLGDARWADNLPNLFQAKTIESFENAGLTEAVLRPADALDPDYRLLIDLRLFHFATHAAPETVIDLVARITDRDGMVVATRRFRQSQAAASNSSSDALKAFDRAFTVVQKELVDWATTSLQR